MGGFTGWIRAAVVVGGALTVTACASYPTEPRYSTRPTGAPSTQPAYPQGSTQGQNPYYGQPAPESQTPTRPYEEQGVRAPTGAVEGGGLPPAGGPAYPSTSAPSTSVTPSRPSSGPVTPGVAYVIRPEDTISGVGRRFQTPVQTLIDLNNLGPRGAISPGQRIVLPDSAVDAGSDPYATGPSPVGVRTPNNGVVPPPPRAHRL